MMCHEGCDHGACPKCADDNVPEVCRCGVGGDDSVTDDGGSPEGKATRKAMNAEVESYGGVPTRVPSERMIRK
jgi:hypothetical protein